VTNMILPDLVGPRLDLIIVGTAAGRASAKRRLYYAGQGNRFWRVLHEAKLTPIELKADDCRRLIEYRIGLTDLAKHASGMDQDLPANCFDPVRLRQAIQALSPIILAFNGKKAAGAFFGVGTAKLTYGRQKERIGKTTIAKVVQPDEVMSCCAPAGLRVGGGLAKEANSRFSARARSRCHVSREKAGITLVEAGWEGAKVVQTVRCCAAARQLG